MTLPSGNWAFEEFLRPNARAYELGADEDADLVGMRLYGLGPFHRERKPGIRIRKKSHFRIRRGDVIYNKLFAWKGTFGVVPEELNGMFVSDKFPTYTLERSKVDEGYLRWYFRFPGLWDQARGMSTGSAALSKLTLNPPKFLKLTIPARPLPQQKLIAARLDALDAKVREATALQESAKGDSWQLVLRGIDQVFTGLPEKHGIRSLLELVIQERGISYGVVQTGTDVDDGVPTLRAGDLRWFEVREDQVKRVALEIESRYRRTRLVGGEVLLRIRGGVGAVAVCPTSMCGWNVSREIAVIPLKEGIWPTYIMYALAAPSNQALMVGHTKGTSYVGINLKDVRKLEVPLPTLSEQIRVAKWLDGLRQQAAGLASEQVNTRQSLEDLVPSALDQIFTAKTVAALRR
jgi:type I restriction enzyme S subunit